MVIPPVGEIGRSTLDLIRNMHVPSKNAAVDSV